MLRRGVKRLNGAKNIFAAVGAEYRKSTLKDLSKAPVTALSGVTADAEEKLKLKSLEALAKWKYFQWAKSLVTLAGHEVSDEISSSLNIDKCVDKEHEQKSFKEIIALPPSALQGLTTKHDETLRSLNVVTIRDLGQWDSALAADAIITLATLEE